ncbi:hypothetical protein J4732_14475 [Serratia marcescens]|uniref:Uncharacterized protein n=1 Tax=Serratia marcescens TaxID=615 RepID=A0A939NL86_SERMA|nr:hypothetical protein [Serratia marcescens]
MKSAVQMRWPSMLARPVKRAIAPRRRTRATPSAPDRRGGRRVKTAPRWMAAK